ERGRRRRHVRRRRRCAPVGLADRDRCAGGGVGLGPRRTVVTPGCAPLTVVHASRIARWDTAGAGPAVALLFPAAYTPAAKGTDMAIWTVHGDGVRVGPGEVVGPRERLSWPRTIGIGSQHVVAMFGATFLVPLITGFPPSTTLFFSAVGT